jgi:hypothetical protein
LERGRIWLVVLPLLAVGSEAAHELLGLFAPTSYEGAELFAPGANARALLPLLIGVAALLVLGGLVMSRAGHRRPRLSRKAFAALPLVVFAVQEHVEYAIGHGGVDWTLVAHPAFVLGLALQFPFAVVAYLVSRLLFLLAEVVAARLVARRPVRLDFRPFHACALGAPRSRRGRPSGDARFNRGPPRPMLV